MTVPSTEELLSDVTDQNQRYNLRDAAFALQPREPIAHVVEHLITRGSVIAWVGKFGSKKTWIAIFLAVCVALGKAFLGKPTNGGSVLIIDEESGEDRLSRRLAAALRGMNGDGNTPVYFVSLAQFNLLKKPDDVTLLTALVQELGAVLVIFDALADIMAGGDENAVKDTQPVFMSLRKIAETTKAAVVIIHHVGKNGDYRGSSAIPGAIDDMIEITSDPSSPLITFKSLKKRDGEPFECAASATWTEDEFYLTEAEQVAKSHLSKSQQYTLDFFKERGQATYNALVDYSGDLYTPAVLKKATQDLVGKNVISRLNPGGKGIEAIYGPKPDIQG
jgi:hypothetical protein